MESWNHILNTALLGIEKRALRKEDMLADVADQFDLIAANTNSKEEVFLQTASLVYNYRQCGFIPLHKEAATISAAQVEERQYANESAYQVLLDIIETGSDSLLGFWLVHCASASKIVQPELIPLLLNAGIRQKNYQLLAMECCGKRGAWIAQFNTAWKYVERPGDDDAWLTGTLEQRKNILRKFREKEPARGRELLQQTWSQENANARAELIQQLAINASADDLSWLEEQVNDKSVKVREAVTQILKTIPSSSIVLLYWNMLKPSIQLRKEKGLLGFGGKEVLDFIPVKLVDESIYKTGIEKVSSEKNVSDQDFLLYQLVASLPPSFIEQHLGLERNQLLKMFHHNQHGKRWIPAFGRAAIQFKDIEWLRAVIEMEDAPMYFEVFDLLSQKDSEKYAIRQMQWEANAPQVIKELSSLRVEWSMELSIEVLKFTARNPYQYNKSFYDELIHLLPIPVIGQLEKFTPREEHFRTTWSNLSDYITKQLSLKLQTLKAFNE